MYKHVETIIASMDFLPKTDANLSMGLSMDETKKSRKRTGFSFPTL